MAEAVCHRCGGPKSGPLVPCKACGFTPTGEERPVAWLFSLHHLAPDELEAAAARVREGERPDPSRKLRDEAREAMGAPMSAPEANRPLTHGQLLLLSAGNLLLTPMAGYAVWFGLRESRPAASRQALRITVPVTLGLAVLWVGMIAGGLIR